MRSHPLDAPSAPSLYRSVPIDFLYIGLMMILVLASAGGGMQAATLDKADNTDNLNLNTSWFGGQPPTASDIARWSNIVTGTNTVNLGANASWQGIIIQDPSGAVTINYDAFSILTLGRSGIDMSTASQDLVLKTKIALLDATNQVWDVQAGRTLTLDEDVEFTRGSGATWNVRGAGAVITTGLGAGSLAGMSMNNIIGPWSTFGAGAATTYATINLSNQIVGLGYMGGADGQAVATAGGVMLSDGVENYSVAAVGALGAGASFHTLRYTGSAGSITGAFEANGLMNVGGGLLTFSNAVTIGSIKELVVNTANGDIAFAAALGDNSGGDSGLTKTGTGTLTLNAISTYKGQTIINEGLVKIGVTASGNSVNTSALGDFAAGTVVANGATLDMNGNRLAKEAITISGAGVGGNGALISTAGSQVNAVSFLTLASNASIGGTSRWDLRNNAPVLNMNGFTLTKTGANYVGLIGASVTNAGHIDVVQGELDLAFSNLGGTLANTITVRNGATLSVYAQGTPIAWTVNLEDGSTLQSESGGPTINKFAGPVNLGGVVTFDTASFYLTVSGNIGESTAGSSIKKVGTGVLNLTGTNNTFTGGAQIDGGVVTFLTTAAKPATGIFNVGAAGGVGLGVGGAGFFSSADVDTLWNNALSGVSMNTTSVVGIDTSTGDFTYSTSQTTRGLTKLGLNVLTLTGVNTYTGNTTIFQGTLKAGGAGALGRGSVVFDSAETALLDLNGYDAVINGLSGGGNTTSKVVNNASGTAKTLTLGNGDASAIYSGAVANNTSGTGTLAVVKTGSGTQTLRGLNTYTGGTTILRGTLALDFANGASATNLLAATGAVTLGGSITTQGQVGLTTVLPTLSMTGKASTTNSQAINGLTLNAASSVVSVTANATANPIVLNLGAITRNAGGLVNFVNPTGTLSATNGITTSAAVDPTTGILGGWATVGGNDYATKSGDNIVAYSGYTALTTGSTITSNTASNLRVTTAAISASTANGVTTDIGTLSLGTGASGTNTITVGTAGTGSTGILRLGAQGGILIGSGTVASTRLAIGNVNGNGKLTAGGADDTAGEIAIMNFGSGSSNFVQIRSTIVDNGTGAVRLVLGQYSGGNVGVILAGANTYSGGTWLNSGRLRVDNASGLGTGIVNIATGAQAYFNFSGATITNAFNIAGGGAALGIDTPVAIRLGTNNTFSGTITLQADAAIGGGSGTISGVIQGDYQLTVGRAVLDGGASTTSVTLTNTNTYTGATVVTEGTLQLGNGGTTGSIDNSSGISVASGASLKTNRSNAVTLGQIITGAGSVQQSGAGKLVLTNANTYQGGTTIDANRTLEVLNTTGSGTGTGDVTVNGVLAGDGIIATAAGKSVLVNGALQVGNLTATQGTDFDLGTGTGGSLVFGASSSLEFDLWSSTGTDQSSTLTAADRLLISGNLDIASGATLKLWNPGNLTFQEGDVFRLFDWTNLGVRTGTWTNFDYADLDLSGLTVDTSNLYTLGTISIANVPEPSRALLLVFALAVLITRRRR